MKVKHEYGYGGCQWFDIGDNDVTNSLRHNFYAKDCETGKEVLVIYTNRELKDHGASWVVKEASAYDKETLVEIKLSGLWLEVL